MKYYKPGKQDVLQIAKQVSTFSPLGGPVCPHKKKKVLGS